MELPVFNKQKSEAHFYNKDGDLDVVSVFSTIQGEGPFAGTPAVFVRLAGCNLQCPACDTNYTSNRKVIAPIDLYNKVMESRLGHKIELVVLSGGEPFRQNFVPFLNMLPAGGIKYIQIETNGLLWQEDFPRLKLLPFVVCSPKTQTVHSLVRPHIVALKYIVASGRVSNADGLPTGVLGLKQAPIRPWGGFKGDVYIQPEDDQDPVKNASNMKVAAWSAMRFGYKVSVQMHKVLGLE